LDQSKDNDYHWARSRLRFDPMGYYVRRTTLSVRLAILLAGALFVGGIFALGRHLAHNSGVVVPGGLYRAGQLGPQDIEHEVCLYHIRSILNLRGVNPRQAWYIEEDAVCRKLKVTLADVRMSARSLPSPAEVAQLLTDFRKLPHPILVHCGSGSDRTGLVSAIYLMDQDGLSPREAEGELGVTFGHFPVSPYFRMNEFIELYGAENPQHLVFSRWVAKDYPEIYCYELTESKWHEMIEPLESLLHLPYWEHAKS
jgi:hypothetical protein